MFASLLVLSALSTPTAGEAAIVLPPRCTFECQGTRMVKGHFSGQKLIVDAAFDTWRAHELPDALWKVSSDDATCMQETCRGVTHLQNGKRSRLTRNDRREAQRAWPSLTGSIDRNSLKATYVFRPWLSEALCDPLTKVKTLVVPADATDYEFRVIATEGEAAQASDGHTLYWALRMEEDISSVTYKTGINDLWAQIVRIDKTSCSSLVTAEH